MSRQLKILLFEDDPALTTLLMTVLSGKGHHVLAFSDPTACSVFNLPDCDCPKDSPCADVVISDITMPNMTGIEFFKLQQKRNCKALAANKALMSAANQDNRDAVADLGCQFFGKPFKLTEIVDWVDECARRIHIDRSLPELT